MATLTPTEIAEAIQTARPDLDIQIEQNPGGRCIIISRPDNDDNPRDTLFIGTAAGYLGWSDGDGENGGGWEGVADDTYDAWEADKPMHDGAIALAHITALIQWHLPTTTRYNNADVDAADRRYYGHP